MTSRLTMAEANCPAALHTVIEKALQIDPTRRYSTIAEFRNDLQNVLDYRPITARRTGRMEKLRLWVRRQPALAGLSICLLALMLAVGGLGLHAASVANIATVEAEEVRRLADAYILDFDNYILEIETDPLIPGEARNGFIQRLRRRQDRMREDSLSRSDMTYLANVGQFILVEYRELSGRAEDARDLLTSISTQFQLLYRAGYKMEDLAFDLFQTHIRLGQIEFGFGEMLKSARHYETAKEYIAELYDRDASNPDYADCYAAILRKLGLQMIRMDEVASAEETLCHALDLAEEAKRLSPENPERWRHIAGSWSELALVATTEGDTTEADKCWRQAIGTSAEMLEAANGDPLLRVDVVLFLTEYSVYCLEQNRLDEAEELLDKASTQCDVLIRQRPDLAFGREFRLSEIQLRNRIAAARKKTSSE
ncbi:MAG: hypothetical protein KDA91_16670 [Planctomycetaceae bacterium]|nr:hypothetical protein [Planctomycetaceae bacterium]